MKKLLKIILTIVFLTALTAPQILTAATTKIPLPDDNNTILLPHPGEITEETSEDNLALARTYFAGKFIPSVIGFLLAGLGVISLVVLLIGGVFFLTSYGNEEQVKKAGKTIQYAIIGLIISLLSYSIVIIINNLAGKFTETTTP